MGQVSAESKTTLNNEAKNRHDPQLKYMNKKMRDLTMKQSSNDQTIQLTRMMSSAVNHKRRKMRKMGRRN
jgi:hypothetical protein